MANILKSWFGIEETSFVHNQLYVTASRVSNSKGLKILICDEDGKNSISTTNVVYKEVFFYNL